MSSRHKIAVVHPHIWLGGGSEVSAIWMLEALKNLYNVYLISTEVPSFEDLNSCFGTNLAAKEINILKIAIPKIFDFFPIIFSVLRNYRLSRFCKKVSPHFNLMISAYGMMDFGRVGIQYIQDFSFDDRLRREFASRPFKHNGLFYKSSIWRKLYLILGKRLSHLSEGGFSKNVTISISYWCSKILRERLGIQARVIYAPVVGKYKNIPWEEKENGFIYLGRIVPEKRVDEIIAILKKVKKTIPNIHLHIIGRPDHSGYYKYITQLALENSDWIYMEGVKIGDGKYNFLSRHKFGISGCQNETLGIAVAEMVKAGCIVWVPDGGGQVEIVDHPELIYRNQNEAVDKIVSVLRDHTRQVALKKHLISQSKRFSIESFLHDFRAIVDRTIKMWR